MARSGFLALGLAAVLTAALAIAVSSGRDVSAGSTGWSAATLAEVPWSFYVHYPYSDIGVDGQGAAHISYQTLDAGLGYATNTRGCWSGEEVYRGRTGSAQVSVARENALALDSAGRPHISFSYSDGHAEDLMVATNKTGAWVATTVDSELSVGLENSIALDANGAMRISHWKWNDETLRYSANVTGTWTTETIGKAPWDRTAIALDSAGHVYVAHGDGGRLVYTTNATGAWTTSVIAASGRSPSLAIDAHDKLHVSYTHNSDLVVATNAGGAWTSTTVAQGAAPDVYHALAVDRAGYTHVSFYDGRNGDLKYANNVGGWWQVETVDSPGDVGRSNAIAVDAAGKVSISYRDDRSSPAPIYSMWGSSPGDVFAGGYPGVILHYDGRDWQRMGTPGSSYITGIWGSSPADVFATDEFSGAILRYDGASWRKMAGLDTDYLEGIWGSSPSNVYAVGYDLPYSGRIWHYDGTTWRNVLSGGVSGLYDIRGSSADSIYAVGAAGAILHYDGKTWTNVNTTTYTGTLFAVWPDSAGHVFAGGQDGAILRYDGRAWQKMETPAGMQHDDVQGLWGNGASDLYAITSSDLWHFSGDDWQKVDGLIWPRSGALWGFSNSDILAGDGDQIAHYDGRAWQRMLHAYLKVATNAAAPVLCVETPTPTPSATLTRTPTPTRTPPPTPTGTPNTAAGSYLPLILRLRSAP